MKTCLKTLSLILTTLSLISLISNLAEIGLTGVTSHVIKYYRIISYDIFSLKGLIEINQTLVDLWTISFIGAAAYAKSPSINDSKLISSLNLKSFGKLHRAFVFVIFGLTMLGIIIIYNALNPFTYADELHEQPLDLYKESGRNLILIIFALLLIFAYNAYAPSL